MSGMMSVWNNIAAMNANRMLGLNRKTKAKSTEKLSSGYKINRAADDAAGLAISEKMRKQIRGLTQASANCQDGVSLCQVADGALNETQDILQRINELAIKAANGTLSDKDREHCQEEVEQLKSEIDRIATTTTFNDEIHPLFGGVETYLKNIEPDEQTEQPDEQTSDDEIANILATKECTVGNVGDTKAEFKLTRNASGISNISNGVFEWLRFGGVEWKPLGSIKYYDKDNAQY